MPPPINTDLTQARLKELLHYDPETGHFTWLVRRNQLAEAGSEAGMFGLHGYRVIGVDRTLYLAHRLAFLYVLGEWPPHLVDHVNRDRSDNRWCNLRTATPAESSANRGMQSNNRSGFAGVCWDQSRGKWAAKGQKYGKAYFLGRYHDLEDAAAAAQKWREENHGDFAC